MRSAEHPGVARHLVAVVIFSLLAVSGAQLLARDAAGLAVPTLLTGIAGAAGAAVLAAATYWRTRPGVRRAARLGMLGAAVLSAVTGFLLAPDGVDRSFVIGVSMLLAVLLAAFAGLAGPIRGRGSDAPHRRGG